MTPHKDEVKTESLPLDIMKQRAGPHCISTTHNNLPVSRVTVHPLVLLSVVDHFNRVSKTQSVKRVVGVLLGSMKKDRSLDIGNSFAVQFGYDRLKASCYTKLLRRIQTYHSMKMKKTKARGSSTWTTLRVCTAMSTHKVAAKETTSDGIELDKEVLNLLPDVTHPDYVTAQNVQTNDQLMCVYMGSLVRSVIALHNLIDNKVGSGSVK
ncbi:Mov34/MPN/PAD-1 family protein, partial [Ostertagia ostertagi]